MSAFPFIRDVAHIYPSVFASDLMRYLIGAGGVYLIVNIVLAGRLALRKIRKASVPDGQIRRELLASLRTVFVFATVGTVIVYGADRGLFTIYSDSPEYGWWYFVVSTLALIVLHDAWFYWSHRLLHYPPLFHRLHRLHHRSHNPTPFTAYSFDIGEAVINAIYLPIVLLFLPVHPAALLIFTAHMMLRNAVGHCGYELFPANGQGKPLFGWLTTVTHHDLHHAHAGYNLGLYFTWWDRWMGTEHPHYFQAFSKAARPAVQSAKVITAIVAAGFLTLLSSKTEAAELRGAFAPEGLGIVVNFEPCPDRNGSTCGRLVWTFGPAGHLKAKTGDIIIRGLQWDGKKWSGGKLLNPEDGRTYRGSISRSGKHTIRLRGCAGPFCRSQTWRTVVSIAELPAIISALPFNR